MICGGCLSDIGGIACEHQMAHANALQPVQPASSQRSIATTTTTTTTTTTIAITTTIATTTIGVACLYYVCVIPRPWGWRGGGVRVVCGWRAATEQRVDSDVCVTGPCQ